MNMLKSDYRIIQVEDDLGEWIIQKRPAISVKWRFYKGPYASYEKAKKRMDIGIAKVAFVGQTTHCVLCGKELDDLRRIGCGHVKKDGDIVSANWCNEICLRDAHYRIPNWNGMPWIESYGLKEHEEYFLK